MPVQPHYTQPNQVANHYPNWGQPAGILNLVLPCECTVDGDTLRLLSLPVMDWNVQYVDQFVFGTIVDAGPTEGPLLASVDVLTDLPVYLGDAPAQQADVAQGDYIQLAYDAALGAAGGFHLLNWSQPGGGGGAGTLVIVTAAGTVTVGAGDGTIALNKAVQSDTPIDLPAVATRGGLPLTITDFSGNGGTITITPAAGETIMSASTAVLYSGGAGVGSASAITLVPSTDLSGWLQK